MVVEKDGRKRRKLNPDGRTGRRPAACQTCRLRKSKCDNSRPECALCRSTRSECVYLPEASEPLTLSGAVDILNSRIDGVASQLKDLKGSITPFFEDHGNAAATAPTTDSTFASQLRHSQATDDEVSPAPSKDFSQIPAHRTTADTVLLWPIFESQFHANYLIEPLLGGNGAPDNVDVTAPGTAGGAISDTYDMFDNLAPLDEQHIPGLVDRFLENVHTKNPILDVEALVKRSREYAHRGLGWDAWSCMLLLACALGFVARPFGSEVEALEEDLSLHFARQIATPTKERQQGENCFVLACRRLGLLKPTLLAAQCHFFAGVYLMYTLRPMPSWQHFHQASIVYQLYLKTNGRLSEDSLFVDSSSHPTSCLDRKQSRLEQQLYWSCFKSETEFRVELPLPQSELAAYEFPHLFPTPPSPIIQEQDLSPHAEIIHSPSGATATNHSSSILSSTDEEDSIRAHAKRLCSEEESWYYYLTEVALRRIGNRIINTFFSHDDRSQWLHIEPYLDIATEFETQISSWTANLPPAMQKYKTDSAIRLPHAQSLGPTEAGFVSRELSWCTENRLLEMRSWLYQPFLYYLVHVKPPRSETFPGAFPQRSTANMAPSADTSAEARSVLWDLIARGIVCHMDILGARSLPHRHHGVWYDLRAIVYASLVLLAIVKSGYIDLIPGGSAELIGEEGSISRLTDERRANNATEPDHHLSLKIGGVFGRVLRQLEVWSHESPDMVRHREVLKGLIEQIMGPSVSQA